MQESRNYDYAVFWKFTTSGVVVWKELVCDQDRQYGVFSRQREESDGPKPYSGEITHHSKKRMRKAIELLLEISPLRKVTNPATNRPMNFRVAFQTLTLSAPQRDHTDEEIKSTLLRPFLRGMKKHGMHNYVWKAELQKNQNIHFHILTDAFLPYWIIRDYWNKQQAKLGFLQEFFEKHGHRHPNSTDVHGETKPQRIQAYMLKYMVKDNNISKQTNILDPDQRKHKGKVWDCSANLKLKFESAYFMNLDVLNSLKRLESNNRVRILESDFYSVYLFNPSLRKKFFGKEYLNDYNTYLDKVKTFHSG